MSASATQHITKSDYLKDAASFIDDGTIEGDKLDVPPVLDQSIDPSLICNRENYASELHCLTNSHRKSIGKNELAYSSQAESVAKERSNYLCNTNSFSHTNWEKYLNIEYSRAGENLAKGYAQSQSAFEALLNSPGHRKNIEGDWSHLGVYTESCGGLNITTQIFIQV